MDKFPDRFPKDSTESLGNPISETCNLQISNNILPNACKVAKFKPIFKKGENTSNYRPIS